jgi:hypothetical protein
MQHGQKMQDDEIKDAIRRRLDDGLPCGVVALRQALGGRGGTDRLMALIEEVRGASGVGSGRSAVSSPAGARRRCPARSPDSSTRWRTR